MTRADFDQRRRFNLIGTPLPGTISSSAWRRRLYSAAPYSITTGRHDNHDGAANDWPPGAPRNSMPGPGYAGLDVMVTRFLSGPGEEGTGATATLGVAAFKV